MNLKPGRHRRFTARILLPATRSKPTRTELASQHNRFVDPPHFHPRPCDLSFTGRSDTPAAPLVHRERGDPTRSAGAFRPNLISRSR